MSTALELIKGSLRKIGVVAYGESLPSEELKDALASLNALIGSWNTQNLMVNGVSIDEFSLVAGQASYTMGSGGNFDTTAPIEIDSIYLKYDAGTEIPIEIIDNKRWGGIVDKTSSSSTPIYAYIDISHPLRKIYFYPVPSAVRTVIFHNYRQISQVTNAYADLGLKSGFDRAIIYNLAIELAPEYGKVISGEVASVASESLANIKRANIRSVQVGVDPFLVSPRGFDWRTGF